MTQPVLIVGAGPVGMTLASELTRYGVGVRIVDKAPRRTDKSKALVLWSRTLELLDRGIGAAPVVDAGFKVGGGPRGAPDRGRHSPRPPASDAASTFGKAAASSSAPRPIRCRAKHRTRRSSPAWRPEARWLLAGCRACATTS